MNEIANTQYILGHSRAEIQRLMLQASVIEPTTERLFQSAGLDAGIRVLDLGCGAGDVAMLAAKYVGASGAVVGIDRDPSVIALATERAAAAGLRQVTFKALDLASFSDPNPFDCVVGRYVLIHQEDPAEFLKMAANLVRPGGIVAFHEIDFTGRLGSFPRVHHWEVLGDLMLGAFRAALPHYDSANKMMKLYLDAGLPAPSLFREVPVGGGENSPLYAWLAETVRSVWPQLVKMSIVAGEFPSEMAEANLRDAVVRARSQIEAPAQVCAWARMA